MKAFTFLLHLAGKFLFFGAIALFAYYTYEKLKREVPCAKPIRYSLGEFDNRFGMSREDFLLTLEKAEAIWEKPLGRELFQYDPEGPLKINLIYDNRQQTTQKNQKLTLAANETKEDAQSVQIQYESLKRTYEAQKLAYEVAVQDFNAEQKKYEEEVMFYNSKGGAPRSEYQRLNKEKQALALDQQKLETRRLSLNAQVIEINDLIDDYNLLARHVSETVSDINKSAGKEFNEGLYVEEGGEKRIDIFEYSSKLKLLRVLSHELGHALGLPHNENNVSIMYELNQSSTSALSAEDIRDLNMRCGIE